MAHPPHTAETPAATVHPAGPDSAPEAGAADEIARLRARIGDLEAQLEAAQAAAQRNPQLRAMLEQLPAIVWTVDGDLRFTSATGAGLTHLHAAGTSVGKTLYEYFRTDDPTFPPVAMHRRALRGESVSYETHWEKRIYRSWVEPLCEGGAVVGAVGVAIDITDQRRIEEALHAEEQRCRRIIDNVPGGILEFNAAGAVRFANAEAQRFLGLSPDELAGPFLDDFASLTINEDGSPCPPDQYTIAECLRTARPAGPRTIGVRRRNGRVEWAVFTAFPLLDDGELSGAVVTFLRITERKEAEQRLREAHDLLERRVKERTAELAASEERFRSIVATAPEVICNIGADFVIRYLNRAPSGADPATFVGRSIDEFVEPQNRETFREVIRRVIGSGVPESFESQATNRGRLCHYAISVGPHHERGSVTGVSMIATDITSRRNAEAALRESEERFRQLAENIRDVFWLRDLTTGKVIYASPSYERVWGRSRDKLLDGHKAWLEAVHPEDRERVAGQSAQEDTAGWFDAEYRIVLPDGSIRWLHDRGYPIPDESGRPSRVAGIAEDVTERVLAEQALRKSEARFRAVVEDQTEMISRFLPDGTLTWVNDPYARCFGTSPDDLVGSNFLHFIPETEREAMRHYLTTFTPDRPTNTVEHQVVRPDGGIGWQQWTDRALFDLEGTLIEFQSVGRDITDRRQMQIELARFRDELAHATRLSAMGEMAASIAHELNQPLAAIVNYASACRRLLAAEAPDLPRVSDYLQRQSDQAVRAGEIIRRIRGFLGKKPTSRTTLDVNEVVSETIDLIESDLVNNNVQLEMELDEQTPRIVGDRIQIQQVILNLVRNAMEAIVEAESPRRRIFVTAAGDGGSTIISVADTGPGIGQVDPETVMEPFYSTKGAGMGLGLAISRSIVEAHAGQLLLVNRPEGGALARVLFPPAPDARAGSFSADELSTGSCPKFSIASAPAASK